MQPVAETEIEQFYGRYGILHVAYTDDIPRIEGKGGRPHTQAADNRKTTGVAGDVRTAENGLPFSRYRRYPT